jgi:hypothetical protein
MEVNGKYMWDDGQEQEGSDNNKSLLVDSDSGGGLTWKGMIEVHGFRAGLIDENRFKSHYQSILVCDNTVLNL